MNLLEIRKEFINRSGRFDLVIDTEEYQNNGADILINTGSRYLDSHSTINKNSNVYRKVSAGNPYVNIPPYLSIKEFRLFGSDKKNILLTKVNLSDYYDFLNNGNETIGYYYAHVNSITSPSQNNVGFNENDGFGNIMDIPFIPQYDKKMIVIFPTPDRDFTLIVDGKFFSDALINDTDINFWSESYPVMLLKATMLAKEYFDRNREGVRDWESLLVDDLMMIDKESIEDEISGVNSMSG